MDGGWAGSQKGHAAAKVQKRGPDRKTPRWSAERRPHPSKEDAARLKKVAPLGAPSPRFREASRKAPLRRAADWFLMPDIGQARHPVGLPGAAQEYGR